MKKLLKEFRSEKGAASVLEATIVFPLVFLVVVFLVFLGFIYAQKGFLQNHAAELSDYLAKNVLYPGYNEIEQPFYYAGKSDALSLERVNKAMSCNEPYRYLGGLFKEEYQIKGGEYKGDIAKTAAEAMTGSYLVSHGFIKSGGGTISLPAGSKFEGQTQSTQNGFICAVHVSTSQVSVYLAQNYTFASFFRMIGIGGKTMTISGQSTTFINDSVEFVRNVDMVFDVASFVADKLGIDIEKIKEVIGKVTGNEK